MMFDDTMNLLQMFQPAGKDSRILVLNYSPHIRTLCYQEKIEPAGMWNLFDSLQSLTDVLPRKLRLDDLKWPRGVEFFYTPFLVDVYFNQNHYAQINFSQTGNIFDIIYFKNNQMEHRLVFDDRGIVSSVIYFENNQPDHQDYLNPQGQWQFREFLTRDNHQVLVNPEVQEAFAKNVYSDIEELIKEKLDQYLSSALTRDDMLIVSADPQHNHLFHKAKRHYNLAFSFFAERYPIENREEILEDLQGTPFFIVDSFSKVQKMYELIGKAQLPPYYEVAPYDIRLQAEESQQEKPATVYVNVDTLPEEHLQTVFRTIFDMMLEKEWMKLLIGTQSLESERAVFIRQFLKEYLSYQLGSEEKAQFHEDIKPKESKALLEQGKALRERMEIKKHRSSTELAKILKEVRVLLDLGNPADMLVQIAGLSGGIPQINLYSSSYVKHGENGSILTDISDLKNVVLYYLTDIDSAYKCKEHSSSKIEQYKKGEIIEMWKNTIKELKENERD
jgi:accessory sec system protein asp1